MTTDPIIVTGIGKRIGLQLARNFLSRDIPVIGTYRRNVECDRTCVDPDKGQQ